MRSMDGIDDLILEQKLRTTGVQVILVIEITVGFMLWKVVEPLEDSSMHIWTQARYTPTFLPSQIYLLNKYTKDYLVFYASSTLLGTSRHWRHSDDKGDKDPTPKELTLLKLGQRVCSIIWQGTRPCPNGDALERSGCVINVPIDLYCVLWCSLCY